MKNKLLLILFCLPLIRFGQEPLQIVFYDDSSLEKRFVVE